MKAKRVLCMLAAIILVVAMMLMFLTGCNRQVIDTTFSYDNAILALPDGSVISGKIESWKDYDDGDQIQVKIDGTTYLVHSVNIVLIREIDALVLWELREQLGFGNKRLKKFYDNFSRGIEALIRRYEMEQGDDVWLCTYKLKEIGCDLEKWEKERGDQ